MGGFENLFSEPSTSSHIQETVWALRQIGAPDTAAFLLDAARLVSDKGDPSALEYADLDKVFGVLWTSGTGGDVEELLGGYIKAHLPELTFHP